MPTYDYRCSHCGHQFEASQKMKEAPLVECPKCRHPSLQRGPGGGLGLHFKGSGFYITDYPSTQKAEPGSPSCCPCNKPACDKD